MKLSIAVPAYNAEKTLERTVQTILNQTFRDFEVLIVNNGSKDRTGEIARKLAALDPRVQAFDVYPNIWGYGARLYAWKRAKGEYITTVDADDFIAPNMYEEMVGLALRENLDVVECDYDIAIQIDQGKTVPVKGEPKLLTSRQEVIDEIVLPTFVGVGQSAYVWNKIYRNTYDFSTWMEGVFGSFEDLINNLQLFKSVARYGHLAAPFYHYAPNPGSVTRNYSADRIDQFVTAYRAKCQLVEAYGTSAESPVLDQWVLNDAANGIISVSSAGKLDFHERKVLVRRILDLPIVKKSRQRVGCHGKAKVITACRLFPVSLVIRLLGFLMRNA